MLVLHRTKEYTSSMKRAKIFPHKEISPAQAARAIYLLAGSTAGPRPLLMWLSEVKGQHVLDCLSNSWPVLVQIFSVRFLQVSAGVAVT